MGWRMGDRVEEGIQEEITNTKGLWKSYMETYSCRKFLKYAYICKRNLNVVVS